MYVYVCIYTHICVTKSNVVCRTGRPYLVTVHVKKKEKKKQNVSGKL